jgi:hypothetical protein
MEKPLVKKYYPPPPSFHESIYEYQNINKDMNLRNNVTQYFQEKINKWINKYDDFKKFKSKNINFDTIYNILRIVVKKTDLNWYELRSNSSKLKKYFLKYL